ncbi:MAG: flagellar biosynthesis protein FlhB [Ignavibacteria bacterium]|jgi:flagellar biosynthetic protein FlhB|nr:flagellar biosynthesis protein FlhB [Ignavibacteria bacterium]
MAENQDGTEKTEEASAKRLEDAREKGQVSKSQDVTTGAILLFGGLATYFIAKSMVEKFRSFFSSSFSSVGQFDFTDANVNHFLIANIKTLGELVLPIVLVVMAIALASEISQVGVKFATKKFTEVENLTRPFKIGKGLKRVFASVHSIVELIKGSLKILALGGIALSIIRSNLDRLVSIVELPFINVATTMADVAFQILTRVGAVYILIAAADFIYQKWKFKNDMKMTKQEVKEETKQMEGDMQTKSKLRQMGRNMIRKKMIAAVPTADVIITNPTHFAVAIKYQQGEQSAPTVVAKGVDFLAQKIKEIGANNNIIIVEDPPLARTLYKLVDVEQEIPERLFKAVAQVLAYVYQLKAGNFANYKKSEIDETQF